MSAVLAPWDHVIAGCPERRVRVDRRQAYYWPEVDRRQAESRFGRRGGDMAFDGQNLYANLDEPDMRDDAQRADDNACERADCANKAERERDHAA